MQDDQKDSQEPDPWAGLDADGDGARGEGFDFSFDELDAEQADSPSPVEAGEPDDAGGAWPDISPEAGEAGRLSIFPPAEAEPPVEAAAELRPDGERPAAASENVSDDASDAAASWEREFAADDAGQQEDPAAAFGDDFDAELARELAEDLGPSPEPAEASSRAADLDPSDGDAADSGFGAGFGQAFGDADREPTGVPSSGSPFGESDFGESTPAEQTTAAAEGFGGFGVSGDSGAGDSSAGDSGFGSSGFGELGFGEAPAEAAGSVDAVAGVATAAAIATASAAGGDSAGRQRKKSSGLGQMVGVAAGGLMALPITYAILIWGFQKDPFKLGRQLPPQLAVLLPQKLQPGAKSPAGRGKQPVREPGATGSLDDLAATAAPIDASVDGTAGTAGADDGQPADAAAADPQAEGEMQPGEKTDADAQPEDAKPGDTKPGDDPGNDPADEPGDAPAVVPQPAAAGDLASLLKEEMKAEPGEPTEPAPADDAATTEPAAPAPGDLAAALPAIGGLPGLDPGPLARVPAATAVAEPPPLDLTGIEEAVERAAAALDAIGEPADEENDPARDRQLVAWYRRLARVGEELVRLETEAADSSRPLDETPAAVAGLLERIGGDEIAVADLERLGRMWLTKRAQRAAGAAIVATLEKSRRVGPYWITHTSVVQVDAEEPGRTVTIVSRRPPPAAVGDRVIAAGVMFDDDTVWAAEVWPVGGVAAVDAVENEMEDSREESPENAIGTGVEDEPVVRGRRAGRAPFADLDGPDAGAPALDAPAPDSPEPGDAEAAAEKPEMKDGEEGDPEPSEPGTTEPEPDATVPKPDATEPEPAEPAAEKPAGVKPAADAAEDDAPAAADPAPAPPDAGEPDAADADPA